MRKLFAAIFGSSKNTETVINGAVHGIDKLFYTAEEKAENSAKVAEWYLRYLAATQPQNLARRLIAIVIVALWALLILVGVAARGLEMYLETAPAEGEQLFSAFVFTVLTDVVMTPFGIVLGFYFAAHVVRAWQTGKPEK